MEFENIGFRDFMTEIYRSSFLSARYKPFDNVAGFIKNESEVVLFDKNLYDKYKNDFSKIKIFDYTEEEYLEFKKLKLTHNRVKNHITISKFDADFFKLEGGKLKPFRYRKRWYTEKEPIEIRNRPNSTEEVIEFIYKWKKIREGAHFQFFIGYDINFFKNNYEKYKDNIIEKYFYKDDILIGYCIVEKVSRNLYNLIFRKTDTNVRDSCLFVDYMTFESIWNDIQEPFLVNLEGDVGEKGMREYKEKFPLFKSVTSIDIKITSEKLTKTEPLW